MRFIRTAAAAAAVLALGLTACSTSSTVTPEPTKPATQESQPAGEAPTGDVPKGDGTQTIYLVSKGFQHRFWQAVKEGAVKAGQGVRLQG